MKAGYVIGLVALTAIGSHIGTVQWLEYRHDRAVAEIEALQKEVEESISDLQQEAFIDNCIFDQVGRIDHVGFRDDRRIICYSKSETDEAGRPEVLGVMELNR